MYPASCAATVDTVFVSMSNTPPFDSFSFLYSSNTSSHSFFVFSVVPVKKLESPSYGV